MSTTVLTTTPVLLVRILKTCILNPDVLMIHWRTGHLSSAHRHTCQLVQVCHYSRASEDNYSGNARMGFRGSCDCNRVRCRPWALASTLRKMWQLLRLPVLILSGSRFLPGHVVLWSMSNCFLHLTTGDTCINLYEATPSILCSFACGRMNVRLQNRDIGLS
jgi:hypothetical protein